MKTKKKMKVHPVPVIVLLLTIVGLGTMYFVHMWVGIAILIFDLLVAVGTAILHGGLIRHHG